MTKKLEGKTAVITGGTEGMGKPEEGRAVSGIRRLKFCHGY
jgi:hypothetical protein